MPENGVDCGSSGDVLDCLHSFCARCVTEQLALKRDSHDVDGECPLCRTRRCAGEGTTADQTVENVLVCEECKKEKKSVGGELWCLKCKCAFCHSHVASHWSRLNQSALERMRGSGLQVQRSTASSVNADGSNTAVDHDDVPRKLYCNARGEAVCVDAKTDENRTSASEVSANSSPECRQTGNG